MITIAIANQKGGVGKTTTTINFGHCLALRGHKVLIIDLDPQGNATQGLGINVDSLKISTADILREKTLPIESAIQSCGDLDLIGANPLLARVERELVGITNAELRLVHKVQRLSGYNVVLIDTPPSFGPLVNSALNAANQVLVPVDSNFYALLGIKELLGEIDEIRMGTNPRLEILGFLLTLVDHTSLTREISDNLTERFGAKVFESKIRRSVKLREAPALGQSIFQYAKKSSAAEDYMGLSIEAERRLDISKHLSLVAEVLNA
jgi:chromosome partitioning protein